ncbi:MAG: dual specificity protein phosphatase family protein [Acidobacteriia bacterium]|nr:dual specificity protein phosphatase family protein [Terriglobia bacterium]
MGLDFNEIIPGRLWVGGYVREEDVAELRRIGITTVVSLQTDEDLLLYGILPHRLALAYQSSGIELRRVPTLDFDREALARNLPEAVAQVEDALAPPWTKLYLHCTAGINRSATTAAGFLIKSRGTPAREARDYLTARRDCNPTLDILENFEEALRSGSRRVANHDL